MSGAHAVELQVTSPTQGALRVAVEQRGVSVIATLASTSAAKRAWTASASSPTERYGVMTFAPDVRKGEPVAITIRSRDSPDIVGEVCVSADRLPSADHRLLRAERAFAAAGQATQAEDSRGAFDSYRDAARDFRGVDARRLAQSRFAMAEIAYADLRDDEGAFVLASWALSDLGAGADPGLLSTLVTLQARTLLESQRFEPGLRRARVFELLETSAKFARRAKFGAREMPRFDILRGFMDFRTGSTREAAELFTRAASECERLRDWECAARARQNIATMAEEARDYAVALQSYREALDALPPDLKPRLSADIWGNYGRLQAMAGLFRQAEISHRTSIHLHAMLADCDGTRMSVARLGTLLVQVGSIADGHLYLTRAASLECPALIALTRSEAPEETPRAADSSPRAPGTTPCINSLAAETSSEAGKIAIFNALLGLRDAARLQNDEPQAQHCLTAARAYASTARTKLRLANAEGATLLERGDAVEAGVAFERGLTIADGAHLSATHENRSLAYIGLARAALQEKRPVAARNYAAHALVLGGARADLGQVVDSLQLMAGSFSAEHANEAAISILQVAANIVEQVPIDDLDAEQRATWLATQHAVFADLTTLFANNAGNDTARAWDAFAVSERGRARSLRYAVSQATDNRATSSSEPASVRYRELMSQIAQLARSAQSDNVAQIPLDALAKAVEQKAMIADVSTPDALRKRLGALDATVVEYAAGHDTMFAFVIDSDHIRVVPLGSRKEIAVAAGALYDRVHDPESAPSDVRKVAGRLAALALWPLADLLTHRRAIIIPDDALHTVPFAVLPWNSTPNAPLALEQLELSVMPSTLFVTRSGDDHAVYEASPRFELIGDPVFRTADWERECQVAHGIVVRGVESHVRMANRAMPALPRLPGSRKEVDAIAGLAHQFSPASRVAEHLGCEATPSALRAAAAAMPTVLHIATHGYVDASRPRLSALMLTPDANSNGDDATFGLLEILQMKINSRLVVLSACDTSRGKLLPGEGVLGPAQAFLQAGADSVVASYWRVPDEATAPFMRTFYHYLIVERLTAAAALRRAQLDYARAGSSHDWAAFTLFGWPDTSL